MFKTCIAIKTPIICHQYAISVLYAINVINDIYDIRHKRVTYMAIYMSKEPLSPQEYSHLPQIIFINVLGVKTKKKHQPIFSFVFLRISFVYFGLNFRIVNDAGKL